MTNLTRIAGLSLLATTVALAVPGTAEAGHRHSRSCGHHSDGRYDGRYRHGSRSGGYGYDRGYAPRHGYAYAPRYGYGHRCSRSCRHGYSGSHGYGYGGYGYGYSPGYVYAPGYYYGAPPPPPRCHRGSRFGIYLGF